MLKITRFTLLLVGYLALIGSVSAALFDREVIFTEAEIQKSLLKAGPQAQNYGGWMTVALRDAPTITLGAPADQIGITARLYITLLGSNAIPVDISGTAGVRYDDQSKAFYLENPIAHSIESQAIPREALPDAKRAVNKLIAAYFRKKPVYVLREDGSPEEIAARWLLRSIRIEPGKVVATLSPT
ncbi:MAG: hypothetical protein CVU16_14275 [Betaproteobacteria bacterium HGW-Betaproteobacteria-10]|nr:MAG: hypothetical protein CVU16_14275 [Betaproteobacteria bacterium HGW-Betaproteobacteria-10]